MLPNFVKETAVTMDLNIREKKHAVSTNWPNIATFARRGTHKSLLLSNWSSWRRAASATQRTEFDGNQKSSTSPGESCARLPAGLQPHRHLWCLCQSTWSAQRRTVGIKKKQSVAAPLATDFCKSDHLQLSISDVWPFNAAKCCQKTAVTMARNIQKKTRRLNELAKHRNQIFTTRHREKIASLKLVQLAPRSFCHAVDGIRLHPWRFRDTRLKCFRCSRTSPAAWLGPPLLSLKTSTNWWKATSENCTRPLQSMSFSKFFLSVVSMLIEVWPRAAIAALGT